MEVLELLDEFQKKVLADEKLREKILQTKEKKESVAEFCKICREEGYPLYEMDLICAGEEFYASMRRSTNGGGENSPMLEGEDDYYELFLAGIK